MVDLIDRQLAIDGKIAIARNNGLMIFSDEAVPVAYLQSLPSVQPDIILCKDCKNFEPYKNMCQGFCSEE